MIVKYYDLHKNNELHIKLKIFTYSVRLIQYTFIRNLLAQKRVLAHIYELHFLALFR